MPRKIKIKDKTFKKERKKLKEVPKIASENYSYYTLILSIRAFLDYASTYFKIRRQADESRKIKYLRNDMIDFNIDDWKNIINRLFTFIIKKYPEKTRHDDFLIMEDRKIIQCSALTKKLHFMDLYKLYGGNFKSKYKEVEQAMFFLGETIARFNVMEECAYSSNLKMKVSERKTVRTIITLFNKRLRPAIMEIITED